MRQKYTDRSRYLFSGLFILNLIIVNPILSLLTHIVLIITLGLYTYNYAMRFKEEGIKRFILLALFFLVATILTIMQLPIFKN